MGSSERDAVLAAIDPESTRQLLVDLVNIESPPGEEGAIANYLVERFRSAGLKAFLQEADANRPNAVGILEGQGDGLSLMLNGHLDTSHTGREAVGLKAGSGILPSPSSGSRAVQEGDRVYGLGAYNMKGGVAAMTVAAEAIRRAGVRLRGDLIVAGVVGEIVMAPVDEFSTPTLRGYTRGTHYLVTHGVTADMAIVGEPTGSNILLGHFGVHWVKVSTYGVSVNTAYSEGVRGPIDRMLRIIETLREWTPTYQERILAQYAHMRTRPVVRIAAIKGGAPWRLARPGGACSIYLDIRTPEPAHELKRALRQPLEALKARIQREDPEFDFDVDLYLTQPGAEIDPDHVLVRVLGDAYGAIHGDKAEMGYSAINSDASVLTHFEIPALNYGPSPDEKALTAGGREFQSVTEVVKAAQVYALVALDICNRPASDRKR
jgi:acetylornithine deacetylase